MNTCNKLLLYFDRMHLPVGHGLKSQRCPCMNPDLVLRPGLGSMLSSDKLDTSDAQG